MSFDQEIEESLHPVEQACKKKVDENEENRSFTFPPSLLLLSVFVLSVMVNSIEVIKSVLKVFARYAM